MSWTDARLDAVPLVHVSNGADSTGVACAQAEAGLLPRSPGGRGPADLLDPRGRREGGATLWLQLQELPWAPTGDAAGGARRLRRLDPELADAYADRVLARSSSTRRAARPGARPARHLPDRAHRGQRQRGAR